MLGQEAGFEEQCIGAQSNCGSNTAPEVRLSENGSMLLSTRGYALPDQVLGKVGS